MNLGRGMIGSRVFVAVTAFFLLLGFGASPARAQSQGEPVQLGIAYPLWNLRMDQCELPVPVAGSGFEGLCLRDLPDLFAAQRAMGGSGPIQIVVVSREVDFDPPRDITPLIARSPFLLRVEDRQRPDGSRYFQVTPVTRVGSAGQCPERFFNRIREYDGAALVFVARVCAGQSAPALPRDNGPRDSGADPLGDAVRAGLGIGAPSSRPTITPAPTSPPARSQSPTRAGNAAAPPRPASASRLRTVIPAFEVVSSARDQYGRTIEEFRCGASAGGYGERLPDFDGDGFSGCTEFGSAQYAGYVALTLAQAASLTPNAWRATGFETINVTPWPGPTPGAFVVFRSPAGECYFIAAPRSEALTDDPVADDLWPLGEVLANLISNQPNCSMKTAAGYGQGAPLAGLATIAVKRRNAALMNGGAYLFGSPPEREIDNAYWPFLYKFDRGVAQTRPARKVLTPRFAIGTIPATFGQFVRDYESAVGVTRD